MNYIAVAIDGPSGAGKSSIARVAANKLGFLYVDTGALYRTIGLAAFREDIDAFNLQEVLSILTNVKVTLGYEKNMQRVYLNDEDVTDLIRTPQVSKYASHVSAIPQVRDLLLNTQREIAKSNNVIMDGRDIGTVILPNAAIKIFLTASAKTRAQRRCAELQAKGQPVDLEQVMQDMRQRDDLDAARDIAPLRQAPGAVLLDTSDLSFDESVQAVLDIICQSQQL